MTLPALPLYSGLSLRRDSAVRLALRWLAGGDKVMDILTLDVSEDVIASMLLQAACNNTACSRRWKEEEIRQEGYLEGYRQANRDRLERYHGVLPNSAEDS
jgi:hypothetical protein